ncbi:MAG: FG-GAP repeat domain-containing protein, partial [Verrucomicrobiota bacterium]
PGRWPEAGPSLVLRAGASGWETAQVLTNAGLVGSAVFTDWDQDGDADLVVAAEWSPLRLYRNEAGRLVEWTNVPGLSDRPGWWTSVRAGDFDGDGRPDLVAGNWGRNFRPDPVADDDRGMVVVWEAGDAGRPVVPLVGRWDGGAADFRPWRERKVVADALPGIGIQFPDHISYGQGRMREIAWEQAERVRTRAASWFASTAFLNRGDRFEARELPVEAQFAPVFGLAVADFDGDGREDVVVTQNFFATDAETARQDAGGTLVLAGQGDGTFRAWRAAEAGLRMEGEGRGLAVADFDGDGRADLATAQYRGPVELWRNTFARPGRRVTLEGPPGNPRAAGASFRVRDGRGWGPRRENPLGGGWRSLDSATHVVAPADPPQEIEVRWPEGPPETLAWPADAREVWIQPGRVRTRR